MTAYSQNPPTIEEMQEILFTIRILEKSAGKLDHKVSKAVADAKYILQDAIERKAA